MSGKKENSKLGVIALAALVVSAMIGGGIFSLPQNMAQHASQGAIIVAWLITGAGIFFLANTFRILSIECPEATTGIYTYARTGFGRFAGFQMAWSYWLCNIFGNVGYAVLLMDALDYFFPGCFTGGNNLWSVIGGSLVIWLMNFAVLRGVKQAAYINTLGTVCKLLPIALFILVMLYFFRARMFFTDFTGKESIPMLELVPLGSFTSQIKSTMLVTLWAFIGIEGAVVVSGSADDPRTVGRATMLGFAACLTIYVLLSLLPFGSMPQSRIASLANPSTAPLLEMTLHRSWGGDVMNLGVIIALLTSWLAFTIMIAQIPYAAAQDGTFPAFFRQVNRNGTPSASLWVTSTVMQLAMIMAAFAGNAWNTMLSITGVMILPPYLCCTLFLWKRSAGVKGKRFHTFCGIAGTLYALWMIYAAGIHYLILATWLMLAGIPLYLQGRKEHLQAHPEEPERRNFTPGEAAGAAALAVIALVSLIAVLADNFRN